MPASVSTRAAATGIFAAAQAAPLSDSAFDANWQAIVERLTVTHHFALPDSDLRSIRHVYTAFFEAGPDINCGYRLGMMTPVVRAPYPTYAQVQTLTNADGLNMAFLASEENYQVMRALEMKNLVVPVVGNFAGPKAIRGVAEYLRQRGGTVSSFYLSNVEQYLFRSFEDASRFYSNVQTLPIDSTSTFIRSVPPNGFPGGPFVFATPFAASSNNYYSVSVVDSGGVRVITTTVDSAGQRVTSRRIDSTGSASPVNVFRALRARDDSLARLSASIPPGSVVVTRPGVMNFGLPAGMGSLVSGLASIRESLDAFAKGQLSSYAQAIAMTKTDGWKR